MTKTLNIRDVAGPLAGLLAVAQDGDEIIIEDNGRELAKIIPVRPQPNVKQRKFGRGRAAGYFMLDDFDAELPDAFWGFEKEL